MKPSSPFLVTSITVAFLLVASDLSAKPPVHRDSVDEFLLESTDSKRDRVVPLKIYRPTSGERSPVVLFSHGLGGSRDNNGYLGRHWAHHGYVAVFMQHHGSDESVWKSVPRSQRRAAMKQAAGVEAYMDRVTDVSFVIDQLERWSRDAGHPLGGLIDTENIGLCGHSFGAATTLAMSGRNYNVDRVIEDTRIDAFLPMSPQTTGGISPDDAFGHIASPMLCMTGTEDDSPLNPAVTPESRQLVYEALPRGDKYQLVLAGANHFSFGDSIGRWARNRNSNHHRAIQKLSVKFWDAYLKKDQAAKAWLQSRKAHDESTIAPDDTWEWK